MFEAMSGGQAKDGGFAIFDALNKKTIPGSTLKEQTIPADPKQCLDFLHHEIQ